MDRVDKQKCDAFYHKFSSEQDWVWWRTSHTNRHHSISFEKWQKAPQRHFESTAKNLSHVQKTLKKKQLWNLQSVFTSQVIDTTECSTKSIFKLMTMSARGIVSQEWVNAKNRPPKYLEPHRILEKIGENNHLLELPKEARRHTQWANIDRSKRYITPDQSLNPKPNESVSASKGASTKSQTTGEANPVEDEEHPQYDQSTSIKDTRPCVETSQSVSNAVGYLPKAKSARRKRSQKDFKIKNLKSTPN